MMKRSTNMTAQGVPQASNQTRKNWLRPALIVAAGLLLLAVGAYLATRVTRVAGPGAQFELKPNQMGLGILLIEDKAAAILREKSHWFGPVISKEGRLTVEDDVTVTGPVWLFSDDLRLGQNATVQGSVVLFSGNLTLQPGASVRHDAVLFAGDLRLEPGSSIGRDVIAFAGDVVLQDKAVLRADAVLFAGRLTLGREATTDGEAIAFAGGLDLAEKALLRNGAVLFAGDVSLAPQAQIRGDVLLAEGGATLAGASTITGRLYLNPKSTRARLDQSSEAQIGRGVVKPENIATVAGWRLGGWVLRHLLRFMLWPVAVLCLLVALAFYLGWRARRSPPQGMQPGARLPQAAH
jgi:hypothetical protein